MVLKIKLLHEINMLFINFIFQFAAFMLESKVQLAPPMEYISGKAQRPF